MFILNLNGADVYLAGQIERSVIPALSKLLKIEENEIILYAVDGFIYHDGIDQTSYNLLVEVECAKEYEKSEKEVADLIFKHVKNYSIHTRLYFNYFTGKVYESINEEYPLFLSSSNLVDISTEEEGNENAEVFDGNIFEEYEDVLPADEE